MLRLAAAFFNFRAAQPVEEYNAAQRRMPLVPSTNAAGTYAQHLNEAKHDAFTRWQKSGYRDLEAHAAFVRGFEAGVTYAARNRRLEGGS